MLDNPKPEQLQQPESAAQPFTVDLTEIQRVIGEMGLALSSERTRTTQAEQLIRGLMVEREQLKARVAELENRPARKALR